MNPLLVFFPYTESATLYTNAQWGKILECPVAEPTLLNGKFQFDEVGNLISDAVKINNSHLNSNILRSEVFLPELPISSKFGLLNEFGKRENDIIDIKDYNPIVISDIPSYIPIFEFIQTKYPEKTLIGLHEAETKELLLSDWQLQKRFINMLRKIDGYITYSDFGYNWFKGLGVNTIKLRLPLPDGFLNIRNDTTRLSNQRSIVFGIGTLNLDQSNLLTGLGIALQLLDKYNDVNCYAIGYSSKKDQVRYFEEINDRIKILNWLSPTEYIKVLSNASLVIQTGGRSLIGRPQVECAALGTPIVGNKDADMQSFLWPDLAVDIFNSSQLIHLAENILKDKKFREQSIKTAKTKLKEIPNRTVTKLLFEKFVSGLMHK